MRPLPVRDEHKIECSNCYGNGCAYCSRRGWHESREGREDREAAEDDRADAARKERMIDDE